MPKNKLAQWQSYGTFDPTGGKAVQDYPDCHVIGQLCHPSTHLTACNLVAGSG